jgi:hypothetical protein
MRSPCCMCVCESPKVFPFFMLSMSYQRKTCDQFFPELLVKDNLLAFLLNRSIDSEPFMNVGN